MSFPFREVQGFVHFIREIDKLRGMNIVICTTANTDEEAKELLTLMGAPFEK